MDEATSSGDPWSDWLLRRRHGGDPALERIVHDAVRTYVERVLDGAALVAGERLLDVGTGDGVVPLRAFERVGSSLTAILTDISVPLLAEARRRAAECGVEGRCTFLQCAADALTGVAPASVDAVTSRACLAYVRDKRAAFAEFFRVLRPGGRVSIAEPVMRDEAQAAVALREAVESRPPGARDRFLPALHQVKAAQFPDTLAAIAENPLTNYTERDLVNLAQAAGFTSLRMQFHIDVLKLPTASWDTFLAAAPHPWAPTLEHTLSTRLSQADRDLFESIVRPAVEAGKYEVSERVVYLQAIKPA